MLGEGYDNLRIAVAEIFSAIASHLKFVQFVGRAVRKLHGAQDQRAFIVSHELLHQSSLYNRYLRGDGVDPEEDLMSEQDEDNVDVIPASDDSADFQPFSEERLAEID